MKRAQVTEYSDLVQICLPTHNGESHLAEALESLLKQTHRNIEIVIMDNASTDGTPRIAQAYANRDSRIRYYRSEEFVCASDNWNRAFDKIDRSRSEFFMWASDDDIWSAEYIERLLPLLIEDDKCVVALSNYRIVDLSGAATARDRFRGPPWKGTSFLGICRWLIDNGCRSVAIYGIIRLGAVDWSPPLAGSYDGIFVTGSVLPVDFWFVLQLALRGRFSYSSDILLNRRSGGMGDTHVPCDIGEREWGLIKSLNIPFHAKLYLCGRLMPVDSRLADDKNIIPSIYIPSIFLWPWIVLRILRYRFGLRTRMKAWAGRLPWIIQRW